MCQPVSTIYQGILSYICISVTQSYVSYVQYCLCLGCIYAMSQIIEINVICTLELVTFMGEIRKGLPGWESFVSAGSNQFKKVSTVQV